MVDRFFAPETVQCPYGYYDELRERAPVYQLEDEDVFLVTGYDDCVAVLGDPERFSNKAGPGLRQKELMSPPPAQQTATYRVVRTLLTNDAPSHTRFRALVAKFKGEATADVTVAEQLSDKNLDALKTALKSVTGKDVALNVNVDPSIIGGLVVKLGSRMVDSSLRTKLNSIKHAMKEAG